VTGAVIYGARRPDLHALYFWLCRGCNAWCGCHKGTKRAYGSLANAELRDARQRAHAAFDPIWREQKGDKRMNRSIAYNWLARELGLTYEETHIGDFDLEQCRRTVELCLTKKPFKEVRDVEVARK
jgi:hypothetical protein